MAIPRKVLKDFPKGLERNTYFFGKLLTAEDFNLEQAYFLAREALVNATLLGPGILWGLDIQDFQDQEDKVSFVLKAGLALDTEGRLILAPEDQRQEISLSGRPENLEIGLFYEECPREPTVTVCDPKECHPNRVREGFRVEIAPEIGPLGVVLARLSKQNDRYRLSPSPKLWSLPELLKRIQALQQELEKLRRECASLPRLRRFEKHFLYKPEAKSEKIEYGFKTFPHVQILSFVPRSYEVSPKPPEEVVRPYGPLMERGEILVASQPAREFFHPAPETPPPPGTPSGPIGPHGIPIRPLLLASPALHTFRSLRTVSPETPLKELPRKARTAGLEVKLDPALNREIAVGELGDDVFVHFIMYPVFDGTLLPYVNIDFREARQGVAYFEFDFKSFAEDEPDLSKMYQEKFGGIPFRIIFIG